MISLKNKLPTVYIIKSSKTGKVYIGSCYEMSAYTRYKQHVSKCNQYNKTKYPPAKTSTYEIINDAHVFKILHQFPTKVDKDTLRKKEQYYINKYNNICNRIKAYYDKKEDYKSKYYYNNKDIFKTKKTYYERRTCDCGSNIVWRHRNQHYNSKKHLLYTKNNL